jgi:hypothetical protein
MTTKSVRTRKIKDFQILQIDNFLDPIDQRSLAETSQE